MTDKESNKFVWTRAGAMSGVVAALFFLTAQEVLLQVAVLYGILAGALYESNEVIMYWSHGPLERHPGQEWNKRPRKL